MRVKVGQVYGDGWGNKYTIKEVEEVKGSTRVTIEGPLKGLYNPDDDDLYSFTEADQAFKEEDLVSDSEE